MSGAVIIHQIRMRRDIKNETQDINVLILTFVGKLLGTSVVGCIEGSKVGIEVVGSSLGTRVGN